MTNLRERYCAAIALGRIGPEAKASVPALLDLLEKDPDSDVRAWAASALGDIQGEDEKVIAALEKALNDEHKRVRTFAKKGLTGKWPEETEN